MKILKFTDADMFKEYLKGSVDNNFSLDLSSMNLFDSLKFMVLSSVYFNQKFPKTKLKCHVNSDDVKPLLSTFKINNLEFV